jgi:hypothetical protein
MDIQTLLTTTREPVVKELAEAVAIPTAISEPGRNPIVAIPFLLILRGFPIMGAGKSDVKTLLVLEL